MDFWDQHYYRIAKIISSVVGLWPYQSTIELSIYRGILFLLSIAQWIPRVRAVVLHSDDPEIVLDATGPFVMDLVFIIKTVTNCYNLQKMKVLLDTVKENWTILSESNEQKILHEHTESGRKSSMIYLVAFFGGATIFATEPIQLRILAIFIKTNETLPKFPMPVDYGSINTDKYYYPLLFMTEVTTFIIVAAIVSCDLLLFIYLYHAFGLFSALGYALKNMTSNRYTGRIKDGLQYLRRCIQLHIRAINFSKKVEELYMWNFLSVIGLNMILISITGVQIVVHLDAMEKVIQYGSSVFSQLGHLFVECLLGQRLLDYSLNIQKSISNSEWYAIETDHQKMLILIMLRSQQPCRLTAGKVLVMSLETFTSVIKTSASYFTVLLAMQ